MTPLLSNLAVSITNNVNLMFNSIKVAKATNKLARKLIETDKANRQENRIEKAL